MTLEHLQSTLDRIAEIRSRFESPLAGVANNASDSGSAFDGILSQALDSTRSAAPVPESLNSLIQNEASKQGVDSNLLKAIIKNESNFNPKALSPVGAQGLMQLMPGTAAGLGVKNSFNPAQNIEGGTKYLKGLLKKYQSVPLAVAAYNAGPGAVDKYNGVPPYAETTRYVQKVIHSYQAYQNAEGG